MLVVFFGILPSKIPSSRVWTQLVFPRDWSQWDSIERTVKGLDGIIVFPFYGSKSPYWDPFSGDNLTKSTTHPRIISRLIAFEQISYIMKTHTHSPYIYIYIYIYIYTLRTIVIYQNGVNYFAYLILVFIWPLLAFEIDGKYVTISATEQATYVLIYFKFSFLGICEIANECAYRKWCNFLFKETSRKKTDQDLCKNILTHSFFKNKHSTTVFRPIECLKKYAVNFFAKNLRSKRACVWSTQMLKRQHFFQRKTEQLLTPTLII